MASIKKSLITKLGERITSGEDVATISKDTKVPLEDILAVAHEVYGRRPLRYGAFTEGQSEYLRDCVRHRIPHDAMGKILGIDIRPLDTLNVSRINSPSSNGHTERKQSIRTEKIDMESVDVLKGVGEDDLYDSDSQTKYEKAEKRISYLITQFGKIRGTHEVFRVQHPEFPRKEDDPSQIMRGVRLAQSIEQNITSYLTMFSAPDHPILISLKDNLAEMMENARDYLRKLPPNFGI